MSFEHEADFCPFSQVTLEEATAKATQLNIMFMETSAKAGHNVKSLFKKISMSLTGMEKETQAEPNTSMGHSSSGVLIVLIDRLTRNRCHDDSNRGGTRSVSMQLLSVVESQQYLYS
jgi:hypothetical protein